MSCTAAPVGAVTMLRLFQREGNEIRIRNAGQLRPDGAILRRMLAIGVPALRIISISFIFAGYCIVIGSTMQALGSAIYSMINSLARQLFVLLPSAFILAAIFRSQGGLPAIWFSYIIAEIVSVIITTIFFRKVYKEKIAPLPE